MKRTRRPEPRSMLCIRRSERGSGLLITMLVTLLVGAIAVAAIDRAGQEAAAGGRMRSAVRILHAADSGIELARMRLTQDPPNTNPIAIILDDGTRVESRRRTEATPQPLKRDGFGPPPEGFELDAGSTIQNEVYLINITATSPAGSTAEIEAKVLRLSSGIGG